MSCRWRVSALSADDTPVYYVYTADLLLSVNAEALTDNIHKSENSGTIQSATKTALETLAHHCQKIRVPSGQEMATKVILVPFSGFLCRSDIIELRMRHCEFVDSVIPFPSTDDYYTFIQNPREKSILTLLSASPAVLIVNMPAKSYYQTLHQLDEYLKIRFSFDWLLPTKTIKHKVAVIGGRPAFDIGKGSFGHQGSFEAARALNIPLIIVDRPGHWLGSDEHSHLRSSFIGIDVTEDVELPSRIAEALKREAIDAILTFSDEFVIATAKAAVLLNLPTEPVEAILRAHNKYETRRLLDFNIQAMQLDGGRQLDDFVIIQELRGLQYPVIVKPCRGGGSRGVKRIDTYSSLQPAID